MKHLFLRRILPLALFACLAVILTTAFSPANSAHAATARPTACQTLSYPPAGLTIGAGHRVQWTTCRGNTMDLNMQTDGNFVLYLNGQPIWASHTSSQIGSYVQFQRDGNLVVYNIGPTGTTFPAWASHTNGRAANRISLQSDGNVVIYNPSGPIWATKTSGH